MKIMDKRYGAEVITNKGKIYKYDAVECMINQDKLKEENISSYHVTDFSLPGDLVNAKKSFYLISENLQSPMGANLTSFKNREEAEKHQKEFSGEVYDWQEVIEQIKTNYGKKNPGHNR
jgi:copper chaperone NosL